MKRSESLAHIMPVWNEAPETLVAVVAEWLAVYQGMRLNPSLILVDDASSLDETRNALADLELRYPSNVRVVWNERNLGHGPSIHRGYAMAIGNYEWVVQTDSDGEMPAAYFPELWARRVRAGLVFGVREGRTQNILRRTLSAASHLTVRLLYGFRGRDPNAPYRLMRATILRQLLEEIPIDSFAPNLMMAGAAARSGIAIEEVPVPNEGRRTGRASLAGLPRITKVAFRCGFQAIGHAWRIKATVSSKTRSP